MTSTATSDAVDAGIAMAQTLGEHFTSVTGRVVPWNTWADIGFFLERFDRGAFTASIVKQPAVPLLKWHDNRAWPIGVADAWDDQPDGLHARFRLLGSADSQLAGAYARDSILTGLSVGFAPVRSSWTFTNDFAPELGPEHMDRVTRHEARLLEVSLTPTPAYVDAMVYSVEAEALDQRATPRLNNYRLWMRQVGRQHARTG
jgi:HK97 family phage prohead protease